MLNKFSRLALVLAFLGILLVAASAVTPAHASHGDRHIEDIVHAADVDHIMSLIDNALRFHGGLLLDDHDIVYNALGRTNTALDLLYDTGATGDKFKAAEHLLLKQRDLLYEVEQATLSGNLADLSTVVPLLVDVAQARLVFERQAAFAHGGHVPTSSSLLSRRLGHNRSLLGRRTLSPHRSLSTLRHRAPLSSFSTFHSDHPGSLFLELRRDRLHNLSRLRDLSRHNPTRFHR